MLLKRKYQFSQINLLNYPQEIIELNFNSNLTIITSIKNYKGDRKKLVIDTDQTSRCVIIVNNLINQTITIGI